jgi:hypothetical protein
MNSTSIEPCHVDHPSCDSGNKELLMVNEYVQMQTEEPHHAVKQEIFDEVQNEEIQEQICLTLPFGKTGNFDPVCFNIILILIQKYSDKIHPKLINRKTKEFITIIASVQIIDLNYHNFLSLQVESSLKKWWMPQIPTFIKWISNRKKFWSMKVPNMLNYLK